MNVDRETLHEPMYPSKRLENANMEYLLRCSIPNHFLFRELSLQLVPGSVASRTKLNSNRLK